MKQQIAQLITKEYTVESVFVTFDTEKAQRYCLQDLASGMLDTKKWGRQLAQRLDNCFGRGACSNPERMRTFFRANQGPAAKLLFLTEPEEPGREIWEGDIGGRYGREI
jgi:hypothetical protein